MANDLLRPRMLLCSGVVARPAETPADQSIEISLAFLAE